MKIYAPFWLTDTGVPSYSGGEYDLRYVEALCRTFKAACKGEPFKLVLLVDEPALEVISGAPFMGWVPDDVECILFEGHGCGGWSNVLEAFRPSLTWDEGEERRVMVGLDTIATGDVRWLWTHPVGDVVLPMDPIYPMTVCDAVISWTPLGAEVVWEAFQESKKTGMRNHLYMGCPSEMALLRDLWVTRPEVLSFDGGPLGHHLASYKCHVATLKRRIEDVDLVYFHGRPKPSDLDPKSQGPRGELARLWRG